MTSTTHYIPVSSNGTLGPRFDYMTVALLWIARQRNSRDWFVELRS